MALSQSSLKSALEAVFNNPTSDKSAAATALANAYHDYAKGGTFGANTTVIPDAKRDALAATLLASIPAPAANAAAFINAWSTGLTTYWTAVTVTGGQTGSTAPPTGTAALVSSLTTTFASQNTASAAATGLSAALHTCTLTVLAAVSPPAATVLPIA
jgi:hypothetical protein